MTVQRRTALAAAQYDEMLDERLFPWNVGDIAGWVRAVLGAIGDDER